MWRVFNFSFSILPLSVRFYPDVLGWKLFYYRWMESGREMINEKFNATVTRIFSRIILRHDVRRENSGSSCKPSYFYETSDKPDFKLLITSDDKVNWSPYNVFLSQQERLSNSRNISWLMILEQTFYAN